MFVNFSALTSKYSFSLDDVKSELPSSSNDLSVNTANEDHEDIINTSLAIGYYWSDSLSFRMNYIDGIELFSFHLQPLFGSFEPIDEFDGDMSIIDFDAKYRFVEIKHDLSLYLTAGVAYHRLNAKVVEITDNDDVVLKKNITELNTKFGVGVQWDFFDNFGASFGYTHYAFASIDKVYLEMEYRW